MYDPMTVIHTFQMFGYSILTLWHVDPEADGTDDSCGWLITRAWGKTLVGEDAGGNLIPIGDTEEATVNWSEITEKTFQG